MLLQERVVEDWKLALKARDPKKDALSFIITELKNRAIKDNIQGGDGRMVGDEAAQEVLQKMAKQRREAIESYAAASRQDLVDKEQAELAVIEGYLPKALSEQELSELVKQVIAQVGASSMKDMGKIMGPVISQVAGRADGKRIQAVVQKLLV